MCRPPDSSIPSGPGTISSFVANWQGQVPPQQINTTSDRTWAWNELVPSGQMNNNFQVQRQETKATFTADQLKHHAQNTSINSFQASTQQLQRLQMLQQEQILQHQLQMQQNQLQQYQQLPQAMAPTPWNSMKTGLHCATQEDVRAKIQNPMSSWPHQPFSSEAWAKASGYMDTDGMVQVPAQGHTAPSFAWGCGADMDGPLMVGADGAMAAENEEELDEKKYKRMMSNRASAKRSRQRRQCRLEELEIQSAKLKMENSAVQRRLTEAKDQIRRFQEQNTNLERELKRLRKELGGCTAGDSGNDKASVSSLSTGSAGKTSILSSPHVTDVKGANEAVNPTNKRKRSDDAVVDTVVAPDSAVVKTEALYLEDDDFTCAEETEDCNTELTASAAAEAPANAAGWESMGDAADGEFFATLIECFDGKPMEPLQ
eukprot:TRINITY_DN12245_c0_g1_i1.p1 TRINITY_DN12245_c0_g1~~TRINITY_DN12245_c0_g1_i1.p1  ORF type:complete len:430 (-),score=47.16 TRINITY_DN12245_c0_g1_i1:165-1454(-)